MILRVETDAERRAAALADLRESLAALFAASRRVRARALRREGELGFTNYLLVRALAPDRELTAGQLAAAAELAAPTVTEALERLVADGVVDRRRSEADRRVVLNRLTPHGLQLYRRTHGELTALWERELADLSEEELREGARLLGYLRRLLDEI